VRKMLNLTIIVLIALMFFLVAGCTRPTPPISEDEYDESNTEIKYLKVLPSQAEMKANQTQRFEVKAYNSDNKIINIDVSQIKWTCVYQCIACGAACNISPRTNSRTATFNIKDYNKIGRYEVWVNYGGTAGQWAQAIVNVK